MYIYSQAESLSKTHYLYLIVFIKMLSKGAQKRSQAVSEAPSGIHTQRTKMGIPWSQGDHDQYHHSRSECLTSTT